MYTRFYPFNVDFLCILADYLNNHCPFSCEQVALTKSIPYGTPGGNSFVVIGADKHDVWAPNLNLRPIHPTPGWPDYACDRCNYDRHICPFCGDNTTHKVEVHPECAEEADAIAATHHA